MGDRKARREKKSSPLKIFLITLLVLFLTSGAVLAYYVNFLGNKMGDNTGTVAKKVEAGEPINVLLLGVDAGDYTEQHTHQRSDTMMLVRYIPETNKVYMLSIPRDTKVKIDGKTHKINAAHAIGGPSKAIKSVEDLIDVDINYYASINYEGFKECVDAVGGVDIVVPQNMHYKASDITINFKKGENVHLNGADAERFVRWRKNNDGTGYALGDVGRAETQQVFMVKFLEKVKSAEGITKLPTLLNTVANYTKTNMDVGTIMDYGKGAVNIDTSTLQKGVLPGEAFYDKEAKTWFYIYDEIKDDGFLEKFRGKDEKNKSGGSIFSSNDLNMSIYNGTRENGLASKYQDKFKKLGIKITKIDTDPNKRETTEVSYSGDKSKIKNLEEILVGVKYKKDSSLGENEVKVVLGKDALDGGILKESSASFDSLDGKNITDKSSKTIKILNSTAKSGLAGRYKEKLESQGYKIAEIGNHPTEVHGTQVKYKDDKAFADEVVKSLGTGFSASSPEITADIEIILGSDVID